MYVPVESEVLPEAEAHRPAGEARATASTILAELLRRELLCPPPAAIAPIVEEIRRRHGEAIAAIVFYGSCLRSGKYDARELDFYVLVDRYRDVHASRVAALANAVLPPTVYYLETPGASGTLRAKYALLSCRQFLAGASLDCFQSVVWARFCQPVILAYARDAAATATVVRGTTESTLTMMLVAAALSTPPATTTAFRSDELWWAGLAATYGAELRVESADTIRGLYAAAADRYDRAARLALQALVDRGDLLEARGRRADIELAIEPRTQRSVRRRWAIRRVIGKPLAGARLIKSLVTFGEMSVLYGVRKLERHTGIHIEVTDRQLRWFWIAVWPVIARLLLRRALR